MKVELIGHYGGDETHALSAMLDEVRKTGDFDKSLEAFGYA